MFNFKKFPKDITININININEDKSKKLEKQMDSWLSTLDKSISVIEKVSDQVDSKEVSK